MFKFSIVLSVGVVAALSAAHADTFIIQGDPTLEPPILIDEEITELPAPSGLLAPVVPDSILDDPAFHRLAEMCETMGLACDGDHDIADAGPFPFWLLPHNEDAAKRLAQLIEDREDFAEAMEEHFETLPVPHVVPVPRPPRMLFGWNGPVVGPQYAPLVRPRVTPQVPLQFGHLFPTRPHLSVPHVPRPGGGAHDLSGFYHRLNTPAVVPRAILPRATFPWRTF
ncbi:hypothetical protein [Jannaschia sp. CCS1]|uniref:hypothetical protein n=1 Tax=Jannaschia sp. (strain CCS1) TaxID=290400 RepID=UPI000053C172|nr:hypothetical protein [Jannaschia sp. CCS1]ABD54531.1 hypothetical protein Jann_1614 [Jannaschia sp. CCS1]